MHSYDLHQGSSVFIIVFNSHYDKTEWKDLVEVKREFKTFFGLIQIRSQIQDVKRIMIIISDTFFDFTGKCGAHPKCNPDGFIEGLLGLGRGMNSEYNSSAVH